MRKLILAFLAFAIGGVMACNSNESLLTQNPRPANPQQAATPAADNARRITADELHKLWEKDEVVLIDTRAESAFKQEHIKGAISVPAGTLSAKLSQLPKGKMIAAYCT